MSLFEGLFRTAMLALAGLVTLSILGSIAALSTEEGPRPFLSERPTPPAVQGEPASDAPAPAPREDEPQAGEDAGGAGKAAAAEPPPRGEAGRWLEAIAYALLALAGLTAIGLLLLWRAAREIGRAADALEGLSRRPPP